MKGEEMNLLLTSAIPFYFKNEQGEKIAQHFGNENKIFDMIKTLTPRQNNFVFVASNETNYEATDIYANITFESFDMTIPFENYIILDGRTKDNAKDIIDNADLIFLCGGHVPSQNKFFQNINLKSLIKNSKALIIGQSAGSMNAAKVVYAQPELEGESIDPNFKRYIDGLGLTNISILPHFEQCIDDILDGKNVLKEISIPDSKTRPFIAYSDGAYIHDNGKNQIMYGKSYLFKDGTYKKLTDENSVTDITKIVEKVFANNEKR